MNIIKRNGMEVPFDRQKIVTAITKANETVNEEARVKPIYIEAIAQDVEEAVMARISVVHVEDIQDMVVFALMKHAPVVAPADTPITPSNVMPFSINTSSTPAV